MQVLITLTHIVSYITATNEWLFLNKNVKHEILQPKERLLKTTTKHERYVYVHMTLTLKAHLVFVLDKH